LLLSECFNKFILTQKIKGNSIETIKNYERQINYFINFTGDIDINLLTYDKNPQ